MTTESNQPRTTRIPNFFHLLLFLALTLVSLILCELVVAALHPHHIEAALADQRLQLFANAGIYALAVTLAAVLFPMIWHRSFAEGVRYNPKNASLWLIPVGFALGLTTNFASRFLPIPDKLPIDKIFQTPGIIWLLTLFGVVIAPAFEELLFRGFLLPAVAIGVDYFLLPRAQDPEISLARLETWRSSDGFSKNALAFASVVTSLAFAAIHAPQLGFSVAAVGLLWTVSMVLCAVRLRTHSVAASTLVHSCYNLSIFAAIFIGTNGYHHMDKL